MSLDGKISTGEYDCLDFDADLPLIDGVKEGLYQYYEIEGTTDLWSLNSGRVQAKIGANEKETPEKMPVSFVLIDNTHLKESGVRYFCAKSDKFVLVTSNRNHPAFCVKEKNLHIIFQEKSSIADALRHLYAELGCERLTIQSGGTLNSVFLREGLIDFVDIIVAPLLVGGKNTPTLIDGESISSLSELSELGVLELIECTPFKNSYVRLRYKVINSK
jgi:2,5-diamino-6-(ribosylamino)-4(3H)-pyrimidinone 5'-phosphate reductase